MRIAIIVLVVVVVIQGSLQQTTQCNSPSECHDKECCVSNIRPIGKRNSNVRMSSGHCVPMGMQGSGCLVRFGNTTVRPTKVVVACPCSPGLYCKGNHVYDIPLGETGTCTLP